MSLTLYCFQKCLFAEKTKINSTQKNDLHKKSVSTFKDEEIITKLKNKKDSNLSHKTRVHNESKSYVSTKDKDSNKNKIYHVSDDKESKNRSKESLFNRNSKNCYYF